MSEQDQKLKQYIIINEEHTLEPAKFQKFLAKASMSLMTRCFEGAEGFIGRHENKAYQKIVIDWLDNHDQDIELRTVESEDLCDVYYYTAEMQGIPARHIFDGNNIVMTVIGPEYISNLEPLLEGTNDHK